MGISTLLGFVFTFSFLLNLGLEFFLGHRVSAETEVAGLDLPEMGQLGYPEFVFREESRCLLDSRRVRSCIKVKLMLALSARRALCVRALPISL